MPGATQRRRAKNATARPWHIRRPSGGARQSRSSPGGGTSARRSGGGGGHARGAAAGGGAVSTYRDYAFLSDCEATALVAPSGDVEWMCLPRMGFAERLRRYPRPWRGRISPGTGGRCRAGRTPLPARDAGARNRPGTSSGWIVVGDVLVMSPWHHEDERSHMYRTAPTDHDAAH